MVPMWTMHRQLRVVGEHKDVNVVPMLGLGDEQIVHGHPRMVHAKHGTKDVHQYQPLMEVVAYQIRMIVHMQNMLERDFRGVVVGQRGIESQKGFFKSGMCPEFGSPCFAFETQGDQIVMFHASS